MWAKQQKCAKGGKLSGWPARPAKRVGYLPRDCRKAIVYSTFRHLTARRGSKFLDSLLEKAGFEPSVPRDTPKFSTPAHVTCLTSCTRKKSNVAARRLPRGRPLEWA